LKRKEERREFEVARDSMSLELESEGGDSNPGSDAEVQLLHQSTGAFIKPSMATWQGARLNGGDRKTGAEGL
jgi:hypothetical protein